MELNVREMAGHLKQKNEKAEALLEELRLDPKEPPEVIADRLKNYIAAKLLLSEKEMTDNIIEMVRINVAKASNMTVEQLKEMVRKK